MSRSFWITITLSLSVFAGFAFWQQRSAATPQDPDTNLIAPVRKPIPAGAKTATFAGGCFWGVEETFRQIPGVVDTHVGYTGGTADHPTYEHKAGHVEAVEVIYDPKQVTYTKLLETFFAYHNPTLPNKDGQKIGKQYRSFVFFHDKEQEKEAKQEIAILTRTGNYTGAPNPIVTQVRPLETFWKAEEHHQRYYEKRGMAAACKL